MSKKSKVDVLIRIMNPIVFEASTSHARGRDAGKDVENDVKTSSEHNVQDSGESGEEYEYKYASSGDFEFYFVGWWIFLLINGFLANYLVGF